MIIERHTIDEAYLKDMGERFQSTFDELPDYVNGARRNPKNPGLLMGRAHAALGFGSVVDPRSGHLGVCLQLAGQAAAALFAATTASPSHPVSVSLGEGEPLTLTSPSDESEVHDG